MGYLLDTHVIVWYFEESPRLSADIIKIIDNQEIDVYISSVSLWEIAIKLSSGKMTLKFPFDIFISLLEDGNFKVLQIKNEYLYRLMNLPPVHKDPFDRMIVSTALANNLTIMTLDKNIQRYDVSCMW